MLQRRAWGGMAPLPSRESVTAPRHTGKSVTGPHCRPKTVTGALRGSTPLPIRESVTGREAGGVQRTRPSLVCKSRRLFTIRRECRVAVPHQWGFAVGSLPSAAGVESQSLTSGETLGILYLRAAAAVLTYDGEVLQRPSPSRQNCDRGTPPPSLSPKKCHRMLRRARLLQGGQNCDGVAAAWRHRPSYYRENRYSPSLLGERCDSLYHPASL